jgi:transposase
MLKTVTSIGPILAMTIALEVGDLGRFTGVGEFASYRRCVGRVSRDHARGYTRVGAPSHKRDGACWSVRVRTEKFSSARAAAFHTA